MKDKNILKQDITSILERESSIRFAYIYGSFAECTSFNDIDIGIYINEDKVSNFFDYEFELEEKLSKIFPKTDVRIINNAPLGFKYNVIRGEIIIDYDPLFRCNFVERVVEEYLDLLPFREEMLRYAAK